MTTKDTSATHSNLLVIDDEPSLRRTLRTALESMGHRVAEAANGAQALDAVLRQRFDLAFLDLRLGKEKGLDLLPELLHAVDGRPARRHHHRLRGARLGRRGDAAAARSTTCPSRSRRTSSASCSTGRPSSAGCGTGVAELEEQVGQLAPEVELDTRRAGDAAGARRGLPGRPDRRDGAAPRRERHGQGRAGPGDPRPQPAGRPPVRHRPLPEPVGGVAGERPVRPRPRVRSPARSQDTRRARWPRPTAARCSSTRSATCRSPLQPKLLRLLQDKSSSGSASRRRERPTCGSSRRPTATSRPRWRPAASARTCSTGST